jgi:hypothetical protein
MARLYEASLELSQAQGAYVAFMETLLLGELLKKQEQENDD